MKSIDEIKKGLECCARGDCHSCPYVHNCILSTADALAIIRQLEAERDAAVDALTKIIQKHDESYCEYCNNRDRYTCPSSCRTHCERFNWRGVQKEGEL